MRRTQCRVVWLTAAVLLTFGCAQKPAGETAADANQGGTAASHDHGSGPHGGAIADWGGGKYHVEFNVDHDKQEATVHVLGGDASTPAPIAADKLLLSIDEPRFQLALDAAPRDGEAENAASRFVGKHEKLGIVREFAGTISGELDGTPYAGDFSEHGGHNH